METIDATLQIEADGSIKLLSPLPEWVRPGVASVKITVDSEKEPTSEPNVVTGFASMPGIEMSDDFDEPLEEFAEYS